MTGEISYDLVMDNDMNFVEGSYRIPGGAWQVFIFLAGKANPAAPPHWQHSTWASGVTGLVFRVPENVRMNKQSVEHLLGHAVGVDGWTEVYGPNSMQLR